jgi:hypothetical protein
VVGFLKASESIDRCRAWPWCAPSEWPGSAWAAEVASLITAGYRFISLSSFSESSSR